MERVKKEKRHRKKAPRVPIKTYKWEDIRRARLKGGYPWTYLDKEPFNENLDPKLFKMDRKTKGKLSRQQKSDKLQIEEISNGVEETDNQQKSLTPESGYIIITEIPSDSENHSKDVPGTSVTIEDIGDTEGINLESAESSDNISQYLDKEEPTLEAETTTKEKDEEVKVENGRDERAKSEEPKRKRKLSIDSSYSRKSLSRLAIMKKLKDAKNKFKVPKISLPNLSVLTNPSKSDTATKSKKEPEKKEEKPKHTRHFDPNAPPEYIHIPLKPPEGETDEFSYLEFGEKKPEEPKKEEPLQELPESPTESLSEDPNITIPEGPTISISEAPKIEISETFDDQRRFSGNPDDIVAFEILKTETIDLDHAAKNGLQGDSNYLIIEQEDDAKSETRSMIIIMPGSDEGENSRPGSAIETPSRQGSKKVRAKSAEPEKKRKLSIDSSYSRRSLSKLGLMKKLKEAKDKLDKFKFPKFSLSKTDSKKKLDKKESTPPKETKPEVKTNEPSKHTKNQPKYIHIPLKPPEGETDEFSHFEFEDKPEQPAIKEETKEEIKKETKEEITPQSSVESPKADGVQFIFLTPPSDDEFLDHLPVPKTTTEDKSFSPTRFEEIKQIAKDAVDSASPKSEKKLQPVEEELSDTSQTDNQKKPEPEVEKPKKKKTKTKTQKQDGEKKPDEVEKPEEEKKPDEENKPDEVPETDKVKIEEKVEKIVVDEEDGLKLTESAMAKQEQNIKAKEVVDVAQELKSSLKIESPVLKKKVSFKRKSKDDSKDGDYEDVQPPTDDKAVQENKADDEHKSKLGVMENSQSMSVDEEKSYLDEQKIIKSTSLEDDYNRWSKLSDHDYEPVNPPPDNVSPVATASPTVHILNQQKPTSLASSTTSLERRMLGAEIETGPEEPFTVHEMQTEIETKYFNKPSETPTKTRFTVHTVTTTNTSENQPQKSEGPNKFQQAQQAIKAQTDKFKTKLHEIKKPNIKLPERPTFKKPNLQKFKFEKPKINLPKIPDTAKITLPTFSLPRKNPTKRSLKQRQLSTESNAGGSKKNYFDFRTYPRLFKKKPKDDLDFSSKSEREVPEFATVPRTKRNKVDDKWGGRDTIRIPLHAEDSIEDERREESAERQMASHIRYDQNIDTDDAYEKENQEIHAASPFSHSYNSRWNHGSFHPNTELSQNERNRQVTDLDSPEEGPALHESFDTNTSKDIHSSESSLGIHRRGVLEEIDSDEFFLRQKGISQDNIEVGMYLSSEIREAFKSPTNALADLQRAPPDYSYDARASNQSLPETPSKKRSAKKPKRKKTPHVSHEQISFDDSELDNELPPSRPKRRSRRNKKQDESIIPYQETIAVEAPNVRGGDDQLMYENEQMQGKEQPEITLADPYEEQETKYDSEEEVFREEVREVKEVKPAAPPRKHRSLRSLTYSEHDSILGDVDPDRQALFEDIEIYKTEHEYIIPTPEIPPVKPPRTLSRSSSKSLREIDEIYREDEELPVPPTRTRSRSRTGSRATSQILEPEEEPPCVEETCVQDFRDYMGYAVIDKNQRRDPPLPPPRTPPRRSIQSTSSEQKFFTVPRALNEESPVRPIRNYSTLGPSRPPRKKHPINMTDEEKENIDITQYIEIEEEPNRDLHSGEVIQKMKDRPLPAPPRPPRKTRLLHDITSEENIVAEDVIDEEKVEFFEEAEVSTQTEPLPDDFECEEPVHQPSDVVLAPSEPLSVQETAPITIERRLITPTSYTYDEETITHGSLIVQPLDGAKILPDSQLTRLEKPIERNIPISKEYEDETSEIPEEFLKLKNPEQSQHASQPVPPQPSIIERIIERPVLVQPDSNTEVEVLRAHRLQVSDLDVDRLSVNELLASRIVVSEIDSGNIQATEISSKSGALKIGEIELPPGLVQQLFEKLQSVAQEQQSSGPKAPKPEATGEEAGQKKTPIEQILIETLPPQRPPRKTEESHESSVPPIDALIDEPQTVDLESTRIDSPIVSEAEEIEEPPEPPTRTDSTIRASELERLLSVTEEVEEIQPQRPPRHAEKPKLEETIEQPEPNVEIQKEILQPLQSEPPVSVPIEQPELDDEPPPRPPQPPVDYIASQPPPSFYALRAQQFVDDEGDIPMAPRRRRHHKPPISRSSSDESPVSPPSRRRFRSPEPTIPQLTGQLIQACGSAANSSIKRLIAHISNNVLTNSDGQQDLHVTIVILLVLIAGLILLGFGDGKTVHYHHWEFFNPPRDM